MWRKTIRKELTKSDIQKKQKEVSDSVNQSEILNKKLEEDNFFILDEIWKKEEQIKVLKKEISSYIRKRDDVKKSFTKIQSDLDESNLTTKRLITTNKNVVKLLEKEQAEDTKRRDEIKEDLSTLKDKANIAFKKAWREMFDLKKEQKEISKKTLWLKTENNNLLKEIKSNTDNVKGFESEKKELIKKINKSKDDYIDVKFKKELKDWELADLVEEIDTKANALDSLKKEIDTSITTLSTNNKQIEETKEINLVLIKREDKLRERESYIKQYYKKAWLSINL